MPKNIYIHPDNAQSKYKSVFKRLSVPISAQDELSFENEDFDISKIEYYDTGILINLNIFDTCTLTELVKNRVSFWLNSELLVSGEVILKKDFETVPKMEAFSQIIEDSLKVLLSCVEKQEFELIDIETRLLSKGTNNDILKELYPYKFKWEKIAHEVNVQEDIIFDLIKHLKNTDDVGTIRDLHDHYVKVQQKVDRIISKIVNLQNFSMTLVSNDTNEVMKFLSVISTIMLPMTAVGSVFGMNFMIPGGNHPLGFYITCFLMLVFIVCALSYFKAKKWM